MAAGVEGRCTLFAKLEGPVDDELCIGRSPHVNEAFRVLSGFVQQISPVIERGLVVAECAVVDRPGSRPAAEGLGTAPGKKEILAHLLECLQDAERKNIGLQRSRLPILLVSAGRLPAVVRWIRRQGRDNWFAITQD